MVKCYSVLFLNSFIHLPSPTKIKVNLSHPECLSLSFISLRNQIQWKLSSPFAPRFLPIAYHEFVLWPLAPMWDFFSVLCSSLNQGRLGQQCGMTLDTDHDSEGELQRQENTGVGWSREGMTWRDDDPGAEKLGEQRGQQIVVESQEPGKLD